MSDFLDDEITFGMISERDIFSRTQLLLGEEMMNALSNIKVIIFGVGGVGSWCAEGLIRTGVQHLTIVDSDKVCITNVNRQLMATTKTVGQMKVDVLRERLLSINPMADITAMQQMFTSNTADCFRIGDYDYVIDAIDSLKDKALLILMATEAKVKLFSSMGAALKMNPERIRVDEFWKIKGDPLARALRNKFKKEKKFPKHKFKCVFSDELLQNRGSNEINDTDQKFGKVQTNGSIVHITAIFGFTLVGLVVQDAIK